MSEKIIAASSLNLFTGCNVISVTRSGFKHSLMKSLFIFAVISGLLFNDPFGVLSAVGTLLGGFGDKGLAGLVSLLLIVLWYKK